MCDSYLWRLIIWELIAWISTIFFAFTADSFSALEKNTAKWATKQFSNKEVVSWDACNMDKKIGRNPRNLCCRWGHTISDICFLPEGPALAKGAWGPAALPGQSVPNLAAAKHQFLLCLYVMGRSAWLALLQGLFLLWGVREKSLPVCIVYLSIVRSSGNNGGFSTADKLKASLMRGFPSYWFLLLFHWMCGEKKLPGL